MGGGTDGSEWTNDPTKYRREENKKIAVRLLSHRAEMRRERKEESQNTFQVGQAADVLGHFWEENPHLGHAKKSDKKVLEQWNLLLKEKKIM